MWVVPEVKACARNGALLQRHNIFGQRASFVRKDVRNLTQVRCLIRGTGHSRRAGFRVVHRNVSIDEVSLRYVDHFNRDVQ